MLLTLDLDALVVGVDGLEVLALAHQPLGFLVDERVDLLGGQRVGDAVARETGVGDAELACDDITGERSGATQFLQPLGRGRPQLVEFGAGDGRVLELLRRRGQVDAQLVGRCQRLHRLLLVVRAHRVRVSECHILPIVDELADIDVQHLRWFVAVADELHFARAAKSLNIARTRLSRTVIDLEERLGVALFVPGAQPTQLTEDGRDLQRQAAEIIADADAQSAAEPEQRRFRIAFVPGVTVTKWTRIWEERFPDVPLDVDAIRAAEQTAALEDDATDIVFVRLPIEPQDCSVIPLYTELPVVLTPKDHAVAAFGEVTLADLADEQIHDAPDPDTVTDTIELVAAGVGLVIVPHSIARLHSRRDLVYRTVTDARPTRIALAWKADRTTDDVDEFVGIVRGRSADSYRSKAAQEPQPAKKKKRSEHQPPRKKQPPKQSPRGRGRR